MVKKRTSWNKSGLSNTGHHRCSRDAVLTKPLNQALKAEHVAIPCQEVDDSSDCWLLFFGGGLDEACQRSKLLKTETSLLCWCDTYLARANSCIHFWKDLNWQAAGCLLLSRHCCSVWMDPALWSMSRCHCHSQLWLAVVNSTEVHKLPSERIVSHTSCHHLASGAPIVYLRKLHIKCPPPIPG